MRPCATLTTLLTTLVVGCSSAPALKAGPFRVSAPVNGVVTLTSVDRVLDQKFSGTIHVEVRTPDTPLGRAPLISTAGSTDESGKLVPLSLGSADQPVKSGYVVSAETWDFGNPLMMTAGPAIMLTVP